MLHERLGRCPIACRHNAFGVMHAASLWWRWRACTVFHSAPPLPLFSPWVRTPLCLWYIASVLGLVYYLHCHFIYFISNGTRENPIFALTVRDVNKIWLNQYFGDTSRS